MDNNQTNFVITGKTSTATLSRNRLDMIVVMEDMNAKVSKNNTYREQVMRKFGVGVMNDNGERLSDWVKVIPLK